MWPKASWTIPCRWRSGDELGSLAASFNRMTEQLKKAQEENQQWTRTLEARVQEKTGELERAYHRLVQSEKMASLGKARRGCRPRDQ